MYKRCPHDQQLIGIHLKGYAISIELAKGYTWAREVIMDANRFFSSGRQARIFTTFATRGDSRASLLGLQLALENHNSAAVPAIHQEIVHGGWC